MTHIAQLAELLVVLEQENQKLSNENSYLRGLVEGFRQRDRDMDIFMRLAAIEEKLSLRPEKEPEKEDEGVLSTPATLKEIYLKNRELETANRQLEKDYQAEVEESRRFKYLSSMAAAVTHEINQPVGIIRAATSGALSDIRDNLFQPTELEPLLNKIYAQTERLKNIIESFRKFANGDRQHREKVNLNQVVAQTAEIFGAQFKHHNIELTAVLAKTPPEPIAWANPFQLEEVLINLLNNAKDALEGFANPQVWIKTGRTATGATEIQVEDNGPGIAPEFSEKLFMPFESTKPTERGTGLGLHISRKIIEALGGTLNYTARNGGGASFNITFPPFSESIEREERDPLCSDEEEEDEFEGWETESEISFGSPKPSLEETEETEEEREEREEQEAEEDRLYGGWETESDEEEGEDEVYDWEDEEDEGVLSTPATRSEHMRLCKLAEQYSKIMREEEYWEHPKQGEWYEAHPEFYDIAFTHLKPKLLPTRFYSIIENTKLNESGVFYELNRSFNISQLMSFCRLVGYDVLKMQKARLINFLLDIHHYNEKNTRVMCSWTPYIY